MYFLDILADWNALKDHNLPLVVAIHSFWYSMRINALLWVPMG
jgi:hypothetical protein